MRHSRTASLPTGTASRSTESKRYQKIITLKIPINLLKIRLSRTGKNNQPSFRVLLQERTAAVKGKFIEELGYYRPATKNKEAKFNLERIRHWLKMGAQPSDTLAVLLKKEGVENMDQFIEPRNRQRKKKGEAGKEAAPAAAPAPATAAPAAAAPTAPAAPKA